MKYKNGFTLIEILIALTVFSILATITASTLYYAFNNRARVTAEAKRLNQVQLAISFMQQDITQTVDRAIRANDMNLFPSFIGQKEYFELTRDGSLNPLSSEKRSTLTRVAFLCEKNTLIHRTWAVLDPTNRQKHEDRILIDNLIDCYFNYLDRNLQVLPEWRSNALDQNQNRQPVPKAIQINLRLKDWGDLNLLFIIPEGLYGSPS